MRKVYGAIIQANKMFGLINDKDKIAIGISGGKDSLMLWKALTIYVSNLKKELNWDVQLVACHVKINYFDDVCYDKLNKWVQQQNLELTYIESNVGEILKAKKENDKIQCSLCVKMKKAILIDEAKKLGCNKIAMGHHADDAIETIFLNMLNEGRISTFKPLTYLDRTDTYLIRPMILAREKTIIKEANRMSLPIIKNMCPNEHSTQRADVKEFIEKNFYQSKKWPNSYENFLTAMVNGKNSFLWFYDEEKQLENLLDRVWKNDKIA